MKKKFAFLAIIFSVVYCLGIGGCSDNKGKNASNSSQPTTQPTQAQQPSAVPSSQEQPKVVAKAEDSTSKVEQPTNMTSKNEENKSVEVSTTATEQPKFRESYSDENIVLPSYEFNAGSPGENGVLARSFENAPPLIPHSLEGLLPITTDNNMCTSCHLPEVAESMQIKSVPSSHLADLRDEHQKKLGELSMSRYDCVACHVVQSNATQLVKNNFEADFSRFKDANTSSNLLDILNQGVNSK